MYEAILFPTDGSEAADAAREHAIELAGTYDATLHVLYVADTSRDSVTLVGGDVVDALEEEGESVVADVEGRAREAGVDVATEVLQGDPHETIVDYVGARGIDMVVMGSRGARGIEQYVLGSVTDRVVRTVDVPVLVVTPDA